MIVHIPVLLEEAVEFMEVKNGGCYLDGTLGGGGHFFRMMEGIDKGVFIGVDFDIKAVKRVKKALLQKGFSLELEEKEFFQLRKDDLKVVLCNENFSKIQSIVENVEKILELKRMVVNSILFDLGMSSFQIDDASRGFSYMSDAKLDMRMDQRFAVSAEDLLNGLYEKELENIIRTYGEERYAKNIARTIVKERKKKKIETSAQLRRIISYSVPSYYTNPFARTFQALRIAVNGEMENIQEACLGLNKVMETDSRVVFITFHSLEEKAVKIGMRKAGSYKLIGRIIRPEKEEIDKNKRSRSAKLRCYKKI